MRAGIRFLSFAFLLVLALPCLAFSGGQGEPSGPIKSVGGITVVTLSGTPGDIGRQHVKLLADRIPQTEAAFQKLMPEMPGGVIGRWLVRQFIMIQVKRIENYLSPDELEELKAMAGEAPDGSGDYRDILYYHVLQDIGQHYACTGAAAAGKASKLEGPIAGRNFDMDCRSLLEPVKTVFFYRPEKGLAFASVAWPGMAGAVSGMNERGLCLMVFSAKSEKTRLTGVPVAFLARRVLQEAGDVQQAVSIIKNSQRMGPYIFLLADKKSIASVEMDSEKVAVRETCDGRMPVANHYLDETLRGDPKNDWQARYSDSRQRFDRMAGLVKGAGAIGLDEMLRFLRDKKAPDGRELAWGDFAAINNIKDAHSVIFDPAGMRFWVSTPPYAYGRFVGFRLESTGLAEIDALPADNYTETESGKDEISADMFTARAEDALKDGPEAEAEAYARKAVELANINYIPAQILGDIYGKNKNYMEAQKYYSIAVSTAPYGTVGKAKALAGRGEALFNLGELEMAKKDFEGALAMDCCPEANEAARKGLHRIARKTGEPDHVLAGAHGGAF